MRTPLFFRRSVPLLLAGVLALTLSAPAGAFLFQSREDPDATVAAFAKNGLSDQVFTFSADDFQVVADGKATLESIVVTSLPSAEVGTLQLGNQLVAVGSSIGVDALDGLRFYPAAQTSALSGSFTFRPVFATGAGQEEVTAELYLLTEANSAPVAENLTLTTYRNVALSGRLAAVDPEGDLLTFQLVDKPARGAVTISEDGSGSFLYTPYENKTGKDSFTYVAIDSVGNTSEPATVSIRIEKAKTAVTYADLSTESCHKAAVRLAEEGIFVGSCLNGEYFFQPDAQVSRSEFLAMAMDTAGLDALEDVSATGFADDAAIATWAKGYVASALSSGLIQGHTDADGRVIFAPDSTITAAEASVLLDRLLEITDVSANAYVSENGAPAWAAQAVANLSSCGMLPETVSLSEPLARGDAAELLCSALELLDARQGDSIFPW